MICSNCKKKFSVYKVFKEWEDEYGMEADKGAYVNIICPNCDESSYGIEIFPTVGTEDIETPEGIVKMPKH